MKFPKILLLFIFIVFIIVSGCVSTTPSKETIPVPTSVQVSSVPERTVSQLATSRISESPATTFSPLPGETELTIDSDELTQLIFQQTDFSSFVMTAKGQFHSSENMETNSSVFNGYQKGYSLEVVLEKDSGKVTQIVGIMDTKTNASRTYDQLDAQMAAALQNPNITARSVSVGDRGKMYVFKNLPPKPGSQLYYMFFTRGNVFELITMEFAMQSSDNEKKILDLAGNADRRILMAKR